MAIDLRFDMNKSILYVFVTGSITIHEFQDTMERMTHSKEFPPHVNALWDLRELDLAAVDAGFWRGIIHVRKQFPERGNARLAHVVKDDLGFGMLRMYENLSDSDPGGLEQRIMVFRSIGEAENWLMKSTTS